MPAIAPELSIIVVNYRSEDYVQRCLASLEQEQSSVSLEILVVDNSPSRLCHSLALSDRLRLIENDANRGFARACNQGIALARGRVIALINPDTEVRAGALRILLDLLEREPRAAATSARLLNTDGSLQPSCRPLPALWTAALDVVGISTYYPRPPLWGIVRMGIWDPERTRPVAQPMGACLCIRREALEALGGFDERYFVYYEDVDWCLRARQAGWRILYEPRAQVVHHEGRSSARDISGACRAFYDSKLKFYRKHFRAPKRALFVLLMLLEIGLRWAAHRLRPGSTHSGNARAYGRAWWAVIVGARDG